jgi:hypothetical protein
MFRDHLIGRRFPSCCRSTLAPFHDVHLMLRADVAVSDREPAPLLPRSALAVDKLVIHIRCIWISNTMCVSSVIRRAASLSCGRVLQRSPKRRGDSQGSDAVRGTARFMD